VKFESEIQEPFSYPSEIVMKLQVGSVACRLTHGANDMRQLFRRTSAQETREHVTQFRSLVQIIENNHSWQLFNQAIN
jgi:hypothetical protein